MNAEANRLDRWRRDAPLRVKKCLVDAVNEHSEFTGVPLEDLMERLPRQLRNHVPAAACPEEQVAARATVIALLTTCMLPLRAQVPR
jgi:hypothetical protein